ncbi:hypothetical protein OG792_08735 [Micromonospora sp. NBC_01699]|uniref:hypothetical protein n=1 Tax=Micromonospora sp. NBC_01699 TaxID=2975984 RepID=UPI002E34A0B2|nr:hypothetical protein [Micromonospora sp. NBC_01699]
MTSTALTGRTEPWFAAAFPRRLREDVQAVVELLPPPRTGPSSSTFSVELDGGPVTIPYRIDSEEPPAELGDRLSVTQLAILDCLYTRHQDGRVRQRRLAQVIGLDEPWVVPFVVRLVGEYVVEILLDIRRELGEIEDPGTPQHATYGRVLAANPSFLALTGQRMASYWNCYHRFPYADRRGYPGYSLMASLRAAARCYGENGRG